MVFTRSQAVSFSAVVQKGNARMEAARPSGSGGATPVQYHPLPGTPDALYPDLPSGGDYGSILSYAVLKNLPTFRCTDLPANQACVVLGFAYVAFLFVIPCAYFYLDNSLIAQDWYYVYRYLSNGRTSVPPGIGPATGSSGPLTLISSNPSGQPADGYLPFILPAPAPPPTNPFLLQVTLGQAPTIALTS